MICSQTSLKCGPHGMEFNNQTQNNVAKISFQNLDSQVDLVTPAALVTLFYGTYTQPSRITFQVTDFHY